MRISFLLKFSIWRVPALLLALGALAFMINVMGITSLGGVNRWVGWFQGHRLYFLLWRVLIYGVTIYAWLPMRRRVLSAECDAAEVRLFRSEVAAVVAVVLIEGMTFLQG